MPFYSLAKPISRPLDYYVITTPDRETANLFYRYMQERPSGLSPKISRLSWPSPQMWKFDINLTGSLVDIPQELEKQRDNQFIRLSGTVIIKEYSASFDLEDLTPGIAVIPHIDTADMPMIVSGGEYFIRNKFDHSQYWAMRLYSSPKDGVGIESSSDRLNATTFRIELADNDVNIDGKPVLIDTDEVFITAVGDGDNADQPIYRNNEGKLTTMLAPESFGSFTLGHLKKGHFGPAKKKTGWGLDMCYFPFYSGIARYAWELVL